MTPGLHAVGRAALSSLQQASHFSAYCLPRGEEPSLSPGISSLPPTCLSISLPKKQNSTGTSPSRCWLDARPGNGSLQQNHWKRKSTGDQGSKKGMEGLRRCMGTSLTALLHLLTVSKRLGTDTWLEILSFLPVKNTEYRIFS